LEDAALEQGCQILVDKIYQNGEKHTKLSLNYRMAIKYTTWRKCIPNGHKIYHYLKLQDTLKIYPNLDFWFENILSGNLALELIT
jgi:hypothetical protein